MLILDTSDHKLTSNLKRHATVCWGLEIVNDTLEAKVDITSAHQMLGKVSYSHHQHTKAETW